ncbi:MAG: hypothetical protein ACYDEJ_12920 [Desulfitobacteriaceae bacterium]
MSCSSIKHRFEALKGQGGIRFSDAMTLYGDLKGSLDAHNMELLELQKINDQASLQHLQSHIADGKQLLSELENMTF